MKVNILFWGSLTELVEKNQFQMENVSSLAELKRQLHLNIPQLEGFPYIVAVNQEVTSGDTDLEDQDEIAFMPPYSGG